MSNQAEIPDSEMSAAELKRLQKEERRRQFQASRPDLVGKTKPGKAERKSATNEAKSPAVESQTKDSKRRSPDAVVKADGSRNKSVLVSNQVDKENLERKPTNTCRGLFDHLPSYKKLSSSALHIKMGAAHDIHPTFLSLGLCLAKQVLTGANSRSLALLNSIKQLLDGYECPAEKNFSRDFEAILARHIAFIKNITPLSVAMKNVATAISSAVSKLDPMIAHSQAKRELFEFIEKYSDERIVFAINAIAKLSEDRIKDGEAIMIYSRCHLIEQIIINAYNKGVVFRVIVVDSSPCLHGRRTLRRLIRECPGLSCSYVLIQSVTFAMKEVSKVFLSATAMMSNGAAQGRVGTAVIAVMAQTYHIPCIMVCESRKFSENAQVNAITRNELCDPEPLLHGKLRDMPGLSILNLAYDITPAHLITMVISEVGCIPATSVPAVTREFHS